MSGATPRRERKVVTVVFCDLVGFTARAESMDPEDVEALLAPVPRARPRGARAPRRHRREVHRRRGDGALRRADRARGRPRARRARGARDPRVRARGRARAPGRDHDRRGARPARRATGMRARAWPPATSSTRPRACRARRPSTASSSTRRPTGRPAPSIEYEQAEPVEAKGKAEPIASGKRRTCGHDEGSTSHTGAGRSSWGVSRSSPCFGMPSTAHAAHGRRSSSRSSAYPG